MKLIAERPAVEWVGMRSPRKRLDDRRIFVLALILLGGWCPVAGANADDVQIQTIEPEPVSGRLLSLSLTDGLVVQTYQGERRIAVDELVRIAIAPADEKRNRRAWKVGLRNGDVLFGKLEETEDEQVALEVSGIGKVLWGLDSLATLNLPPAFEDAHVDAMRWFDRSRDLDDRVLLTNGDVLSGFVTRLGSAGVSLDGALGESEVPLRLVVAIRFGTRDQPQSQEPGCLIYLRDGGRMSTPTLEFDDQQFVVRPRDGSEIEIPWDRIARLEFAGGRWEWLADRAPISFEHTPMLGLAWEPRPDECVVGGPLAVAGEQYQRGIGVHSRSSLTYDLESKYLEFVTSFGLDDQSGPMADVDVAIRVDGQLRHSVKGIRQGTLHGPIRIDVRGANRIELLVDFGANGDLQDRFDWIEPSLIR